MRITRGQEIAGFDAIDLRDKLKRIAAEGWRGTGGLARVFGITEAEAIDVAKRLTDAGLLEESDSAGRLRTTIAGNALACASAMKPFKRATIDRALANLIEASEAVNADPDLMYWVNEVVVFGSYLDSTMTELSDLDVYIDLQARWAGMSETDIDAWQKRRVALSGRRFTSFMNGLSWPEKEVRLRLKGSTALSSCSHHPSTMDAPFEIVYRR